MLASLEIEFIHRHNHILSFDFEHQSFINYLCVFSFWTILLTPEFLNKISSKVEQLHT